MDAVTPELATIIAQHSQACCTSPLAQSEGYESTGTYKEIGGVKCYVTGQSDAKKAIFFIYDVFGYQPQSIQGADILAKVGGYLVVIPDLLKGNHAQPAWMSGTDEGRQEFQAWLKTLEDPAKSAIEANSMVGTLKKEFPGTERWGAIGYCWGGKVVALASAAGTAFVVGVQTSPGRVSGADAEKVTIPMMMLASKDEPAADVAAFDKALTVPKAVETFESQPHGWMSTRADLKDAAAKEAYEKGYSRALDFFKEHL